MNQFLYYLQPTRVEMLGEGPTERESKLIGEHFSCLQRPVEEGTVLMAGRTLTADEPHSESLSSRLIPERRGQGWARDRENRKNVGAMTQPARAPDVLDLFNWPQKAQNAQRSDELPGL